MLFNSRKIGIRLVTLLSIGMVVFVGNANGLSIISSTPHGVSEGTRAPRDWDRYTVTGGGFSVLLPTVPAMITYDLRPDPTVKGRDRHIIGAYSRGVVYAIYVTERKESLEGYISRSRNSSPVGFKRELTIGGFKGKEYAFEDAKVKGVTQYVITNRFIYTFKAQGSHLGDPDVGIPRFFESIKFEANAAGIAIVDGPGNQPAIDPPPTSVGSETQIFKGTEVTQKAMVIVKPEPNYTEEARNHKVTGTVVLRGVFSSSGGVTNIRLLSGLPFGLSEKAIESAQQIRFIPSIKSGHFVSMYINLEYNFNLY